ncbi:MAG: TetR/AcrR family transcriptional regulator [Flavobacteriales bacterium]
MISKKDLLECSITNFIKFGSKRFSMDELASELGISKKTIYKHFKTKEELLSKGIRFIIDQYLNEVDEIIKTKENPIDKIVLIQKTTFQYLNYFKPAFLHGIKKYYHDADDSFEEFKRNFILSNLKPLLIEAKEKQYLRKDLNVELFCDLYFFKLQPLIYEPKNLLDYYGINEVFDHIIINNLRGFITSNYKDKNNFFS